MRKKWTPQEDAFIKENYGSRLTYEEISEKLGRNIKSIKAKAYRLGFSKVVYKIWENHEEEFLLQEYANHSTKELAAGLKRTVESVYNKLNELKLSGKLNWTHSEDLFIIENYAKFTAKEISKKLIGRTINAIVLRAGHLGITTESKRWEDFEDDFLIKNYKKTPTKDIVKKLGRSHGATLSRAQFLKLTRGCVAWEKFEECFLIKNYNALPIEIISKKLNRTVEAIRVKAGKLKLTESNSSPIEKMFILKIIGGITKAKLIPNPYYPGTRLRADGYLVDFDLYIEVNGDFVHGKDKNGRYLTIEEIKAYPKYLPTGRGAGVVGTMERDLRKEKLFPNRAVFWEKEIEKAIKENKIDELLQEKLSKFIPKESLSHFDAAVLDML